MSHRIPTNPTLPMNTASKTLRKQINALIKSRRELFKLNVSSEIIASISYAIDELEDAFIAEVNFENSAK